MIRAAAFGLTALLIVSPAALADMYQDAGNAMIDIRSSGNILTNNYIHGIEGQANWAVDLGPGGEAPYGNLITGFFSNFGISGPFKALAVDKITLTQTAASSNKVNYTCFGSASG